MPSSWIHLLGLLALFLCTILSSGDASPFDERRHRGWNPRPGSMPQIPTTPPFNPYG
ncbi:uncharacterized protein LOC116800660 [Drosophila sechellia]|uniref:Uncharacterized protein n=1 Tax=Drosophila simulans TaxID=7240 RepID=A0A0J9RF87_DROSI|nr:uncharacterized protein LOC27207521 [Drosophila simulans]XP_032572711.1 uncharacterized protein LOC116800660 [Drosophila sechellia]KMY94637.1 uncharacterized protein Dsimw501_GD27672 [Drosophila simulans]